MPSVDVVVECPVFDSFRVQQVAGMFDVPIGEKATERFQAELQTLGFLFCPVLPLDSHLFRLSMQYIGYAHTEDLGLDNDGDKTGDL